MKKIILVVLFTLISCSVVLSQDMKYFESFVSDAESYSEGILINTYFDNTTYYFDSQEDYDISAGYIKLAYYDCDDILLLDNGGIRYRGNTYVVALSPKNLECIQDKSHGESKNFKFVKEHHKFIN